uniref:Uncharacterized protein n=1 Tax=Octopus bimaculoides TaxID=37653 RepID=A0A0L8HRR6_OCTBM
MIKKMKIKYIKCTSVAMSRTKCKDKVKKKIISILENNESIKKIAKGKEKTYFNYLSKYKDINFLTVSCTMSKLGTLFCTKITENILPNKNR